MTGLVAVAAGGGGLGVSGAGYDVLIDLMTGLGPRVRYYGPNNPATQDMRNSAGAEALRQQFRENGCESITSGEFGHWEALEATMDRAFGGLHGFLAAVCPAYAVYRGATVWDNASDQVGGFGGAWVINNGDGTATFIIRNVAGTKSLLDYLNLAFDKIGLEDVGIGRPPEERPPEQHQAGLPLDRGYQLGRLEVSPWEPSELSGLGRRFRSASSLQL